MPLFDGNYDDVRVNEAEVPPATGKGSGQRIRVGVVERDNGLVMAKTSQISNALYDLSDQNSTTHTVLLPHGTTVKLAAATAPSVGSWRQKFEVANPKLGKTVQCKGTSEASEVANQIDLLALAKMDKDALSKITEAYDAGDGGAYLVAIGLREAPLEEIQTHISGYVTKSGKHVGAYSQIRKSIDNIHPGGSVHFPEGIAVKRLGDGKYQVGGTKAPQLGGVSFDSSKKAADRVAEISAGSTHPKSIGGRTAHSIDKGTDINSIPNHGDNPKLPGSPHPADVADRAAKARKGAKLPSRKQRAENERKAKGGLDPADAGGGTRRETRPFQAEGKHVVNQQGGKSMPLDSEAAAQARAGELNQQLVDDLNKNSDGSVTYSTTRKADGTHVVNRHEGKSLRPGERVVSGQGKGASASKRHRAKDESPMPGVIRRPSESDAIRAGEHLPGGGKRKPGVTDARHLTDDEYIANFKIMHGRAPNKRELATLRKSGDRREREAKARGKRTAADDGPVDVGKMKTPGTSKANRDLEAKRGIPARTTPSGLPLPPSTGAVGKSGRRGGKGAVDDPSGSKMRGASTDPDTFSTQIKSWSTDELRREAKVTPNASPLYKLLIAELRRKTTGGHAAGKARNRHQGLTESAGFLAR